MFNTLRRIETDRGWIDINVHREFEQQRMLWVYVHSNDAIYRAERSQKDYDTFMAFRHSDCLEEFSKHKELLENKGLTTHKLSLPAIADQVRKETLVALDPWWEGRISYDDSFVITLHSYRYKNP